MPVKRHDLLPQEAVVSLPAEEHEELAKGIVDQPPFDQNLRSPSTVSASRKCLLAVQSGVIRYSGETLAAMWFCNWLRVRKVDQAEWSPWHMPFR
jgi:hypothetical protein